jgi:cytochrome c peroxidase
MVMKHMEIKIEKEGTMKKQILLAAVLVLVLATGIALAAGKSSSEIGKEMFNNPKLGGSSNESSCNSCHAGGKGLENAAANKKLSKVINKCLIGKMEGEKMDGRTVSMRSLKMFIQSLHN